MARKKLEMERGIYTEEEVNVYIDIAANTGLSKNTVRNAFARKPVSERTARILANALDVRVSAFVIKPDRRGRPPKALQLIEQIQKIVGKKTGKGG